MILTNPHLLLLLLAGLLPAVLSIRWRLGVAKEKVAQHESLNGGDHATRAALELDEAVLQLLLLGEEEALLRPRCIVGDAGILENKLRERRAKRKQRAKRVAKEDVFVMLERC